MKAIQLNAPKEFEIVDIDSPGDPAPGQAIVKTHRMGICGTDYSCYLGKFPFFDYPRIPGHELGVEVIAVGDGVTNVKVGDRCSVEPYMNCGECFACRQGSTNCCSKLQVIGVMTDGGLCEQFTVRADKLHPSEKLSYEQLALVETLAIGCHASNRGAAQPGQHALVIGAGPIGLSALEFVRLTGATVTVMDMVQSRLDFCKTNYGIENLIQFGSGDEHEQMQKMTNGDMYSVIIDATGNKHSMVAAIGNLAPTGRLVYVGITTEDLVFPHPKMHRPEASLMASRNAMPEDFTRIIGLIEDGTINTDPWITHRTSFDSVIDEFETFTKPESGVLKAVIDVTAM
jgi:alcohol dehydrogenase